MVKQSSRKTRRNRRILVTGGSGYLGRHLVALAHGEDEVFYTFFHHDPLESPAGFQLDLRDQQAVHELLHRLQPDAIIHTAGSEGSNDSANVIRSGTKHLTEAMRMVGGRFVHLSTDVIFDGRSAPYDESRSPSPLHAYGRSKAAAESTVESYDNYVIVRTSLIYGLNIMDRGTKRMVETLRAGQPYRLFVDQRRNPVWVETLSRACLELASLEYVGVLNVAGGQVLTRAEFGTRLLDWWQVTERTNLTEGPSDGNKWPQDLELDLRCARRVLNTPMLGVDEVLAEAERQHRHFDI